MKDRPRKYLCKGLDSPDTTGRLTYVNKVRGMTFDTVVFGSFKVGTGFTDGSTITGGGLRLFIKPTKNIGSAPLDVTVSYVDQFGNTAEVTAVSTSVPGSTTSGSHIQVSLNAEDSGVSRT